MRIITLILASVLAAVAYAQQPQSFRTDDGETLYYTRSGSGPRVVMLYGGPGFGASGMKDWLDSLSNQFETILFEQRGTGLSKKVRLDSATINVQRAYRDLDNLREHLGDNTLTLCGYSWGAMLALAYASYYPSNAQNLVLVGPGFIDTSLVVPFFDNLARAMYPSERDSLAYWSSPETGSRDSVQAQLMRNVFSYMCYFYDHSAGRKVFEEYFRHIDYSPAMADLMWKSLYRGYDLKEPLKNYKGRCTIIRPRQDNLPEEVVFSIVRSVPQTQVYYIERCGHAADLEKPNELFRLLRRALNPTGQ